MNQNVRILRHSCESDKWVVACAEENREWEKSKRDESRAVGDIIVHFKFSRRGPSVWLGGFDGRGEEYDV